uniref:helix-turn-helix domain-containing protein n=1 Tax=Microscilla sp. PRE1 TaxID=155537 RepID=UPI001E43A040|nr:helix-turn-helix transcriptional regulator [Microscilla sp. PRE1]
MVTKRFSFVFFYRMEEKAIQENLEKLGKRIKELRIQKGYTNYETFAFKHNIPRAQYGRYEKGSDLRFTSLIKVVNALGVSLDEFFKDF